MSLLPQDESADLIIGRDREYLLPVYPRNAIAMERGEGVYLFDTSGNRYLDLMTGLGVNALGHAHPRMVEVFRDQASKLVHLSHHYSQRYAGELAEKLCWLTGMGGVFYSTGGSEAVEGAIKLARVWAKDNFDAGKKGGKATIIALEGSYHGRTYGSLSVTGQEKYREGFEPLVPGVRFVERNNLEQLRAAVDDTACCILLEILQGEGGVLSCSKEFLAEARRLADKHHALLVLDEIQTGLGRLGRWFGYEGTGIEPDLLVLGKPVGGGIPLSILLVRKEYFTAFGPAKHGSTLGGSPLACRLGLEFLAVVEEEGLIARIRDTGGYLQEGLRSLVSEFDSAVEARGEGALQGLVLGVPGRQVVEAGHENGIMLNCVQGHILRFLPSFLLERKHVDEAMSALRKVLQQSDTAKAETITAAATAR
jgi:acetylornithine/succinyldiaminopimelate/putrescine aminotransferase